jgi:hypothetical protein
MEVYSQEGPWYLFLLEAEWFQGHKTAERIGSLYGSNDLIRNRSRELPALIYVLKCV